MIIKRKYETYRDLCTRDEEAKAVIYKYLDKLPANMGKDEAIDRHLASVFIYQTELGSEIGNFAALLEELDTLDVSKPYDNGLTYKDVSKVITLPSRKGKAMVEIFIMDTPEVNPRIVNIIGIEYNDGINSVIPIWNIDDVRF